MSWGNALFRTEPAEQLRWYLSDQRLFESAELYWRNEHRLLQKILLRLYQVTILEKCLYCAINKQSAPGVWATSSWFTVSAGAFIKCRQACHCLQVSALSGNTCRVRPEEETRRQLVTSCLCQEARWFMVNRTFFLTRALTALLVFRCNSGADEWGRQSLSRQSQLFIKWCATCKCHVNNWTMMCILKGHYVVLEERNSNSVVMVAMLKR